MLTYVEQLESDLKQAITENIQKKRGKKNASQSDDDEEDKDGLDDITGGKDAEIEQYCSMLQKITEDKLIQEGLLGKFLPPILDIAHATLQRYQVQGGKEL